jgi:hypothetical protein
MKISLRKASQLQTNINDMIKGISLKDSVELTEFEDVDKSLGNARQDLLNSMQRIQNLYTALYHIRNLIAHANATSGINIKLGEIAMYDKRMALFNQIGSLKPMGDIDVIKGKLEKIKTRVEPSRASLYGSTDTVDTSVLKPEDVVGFKQAVLQVKKVKTKLQDEVLELNVKTEIDLSEDAEKFLASEGLV